MATHTAARWTLLVVVLGTLAGCRSMASTGTAATPGPAPASAVATVPDNLRWVRDAAEYQAAFLQTYAAATRRVEAEAPGRRPGSWAVVLDADETVISNLTYQLERARADLGYTAESWNQWVRRREATPLPGAATFLARVRELGGRIAIVTNRLESECADTGAVFERYALVYDAMLCRPDGQPSDKTPRFEAVAAGRSAAGGPSLDIVAFVGDNILDFPGMSQAAGSDSPSAFTEFGVRFFVLPNPMYGSWQ